MRPSRGQLYLVDMLKGGLWEEGGPEETRALV